ncbi:MAG: hypothetical protein HZB19_21500 [Chloroflexi bacterium]|nr:hypothetical protein [Chloroflexota bacterium]
MTVDKLHLKTIIRHVMNMPDYLPVKYTAARQHGGGMLIAAAGLTPKYQ